MKTQKWGRAFAAAMAMAVTVTSVPMNVFADEELPEAFSEDGEENAGEEQDNSQDTEGNAEGKGVYHDVWVEDFDGESLNTDVWNVEEHEPGWVNKELQRYTSLDEGNIKVDGGFLHIKPIYNDGASDSTDEGATAEVLGDAEEAEPTTVEFNLTANEATSSTVALQVNFGAISGFADTSVATDVELLDISLTDEEGTELLSNTGFDSEDGSYASDWNMNFLEQGKGTVSYKDGKACISISDAGTANYNVQLQQDGITLENGKNYHFSMKATAKDNRAVEISLLDPANGYKWYGGTTAVIAQVASNTEGNGSGTGKTEITSGRITTQGKKDFKYGRFEARVKVPKGQGYLPAFWLMATDENNYGQWPRCGEIDIMEVMGQDTATSYHTIHYGYNSGSGHKENQGSKTISGDDFADDFHIFTCDWEPDKITWYVDGAEVYSTNDWYTGADEESRLTYPAPFDQDFYIILNLAVGGSWVGNPNDDTYADMNNQEYLIDYVKVSQLDESAYEEKENTATKPEAAPVVFRDADDNGNYVLNGNFANNISTDETVTDNWALHLEKDGIGSTAAVDGGAVTITPIAVGGVAHSVQLKQTHVPMYKGYEYELSFDAYATENRSIIVDVEGPDNGWARYMDDTTFNITTEKQTYTHRFTMEKKTDANGSLEFNLGKQGSTAPVTISNVSLKYVSGEEVKETTEKTIRADGNYIYNGNFDQGDKRLGYWEFEEEDKDNISVTNKNNTRELMVKVEAPEGTSETNPVTISQTDLEPLVAGQYELSFKAYMEEGGAADALVVNAVGTEFVPQLTCERTDFSKKITLSENLTREQSNVQFSFTKPGTYYLDNVFLAESALLKNGSFNAGLAGYSPYVDNAVSATYTVDSMNGNDNAFAITINDTVSDTADNDWYVQLNQDGLTIEKGKTYRMSFCAKSNITRKIKYCLQEFEGSWANYSGTGSVEIGPDWQTFENVFTMEHETDTNTRFNITMGSVDGVRITEKHDVYIDDIVLEEVTSESENNNSGEANTGDEENGEGGNIEDTPEAPAPSEQPGSQVEPDPQVETEPENKPEPQVEPEKKPEEKPAENNNNNSNAGESKTDDKKPAENNNNNSNTGESKTDNKQPEVTEQNKNNNSEVSKSTKQNTETNTNSGNKSTTKKTDTKNTKAKTVNTTKPKTRTNKNKKADKGEVLVKGKNVYTVMSKKRAKYKSASTKIKNATIPATVKVDGEKVKVTAIAANAFVGCEKLKKITVNGNTLTSVSAKAFEDYMNSEDFKVVIKCKSKKQFKKVVKKFKAAGLKKAKFVYKKKK